MEQIGLAFIGFAGGIAVGSGFVAFITVLDIVPRLHQLTGSPERVISSAYAITAGVVFWTCVDFFDWRMPFLSFSQTFVGLLAGCFIGLLAAALTEVINVLPILARRLQLQKWMVYLLVAMVFGKITGSLLQWFFSIP